MDPAVNQFYKVKKEIKEAAKQGLYKVFSTFVHLKKNHNYTIYVGKKSNYENDCVE